MRNVGERRVKAVNLIVNTKEVRLNLPKYIYEL